MIFQQPEHLICTKQYSYHSLNKPGEIYTHGFHFYGKTARFHPPGKSKTASKCFFNQWVTSTHLLWGCWHIHDLKLWNLFRFFSHWKIPAQRKWSNFSKKRQYFWIICVESNFTFCRKEIWSFLKVLGYTHIPNRKNRYVNFSSNIFLGSKLSKSDKNMEISRCCKSM